MGPNVLAYIAVQAGQYHQSISKIQQQLEQNFGLRFSRGAIDEAQRRISAECGDYNGHGARTGRRQALMYHTPIRNRCALLLKHDVMSWTFLTN
jgi:hypothetical protein